MKENVIVTKTGAYIDNFPTLAWGTGMECTYCGCVTPILQAVGVHATYEQLMGLTASCYRASMFYGWDPASNILDIMTHCLGVDIRPYALSYYGWECFQPEGKDTWDAAVTESIHAGIPVLTLGGRREPEWSVVLGYEKSDAGVKFFGRSYFDENASEDECFTHNKYTLADKYPGECGPLLFRKASGQINSSPLEALKRSLETSIAMFQPHEKFGYDAYAYMIESFKTNVFLSSWHGRGKIDSQIPAFADARRAASIYLKDSSALFKGANAERLKAASGIYAELSDILSGIADHSDFNLEAIETSEELRAYFAQKLEDCVFLEIKAHTLISTVLANWHE